MSHARTLLPAVVALTATGCVTSVEYDPPVTYTAIEARLDATTLRLKYLSPDGLLYSDASWPLELRSGVPGDDGRVAAFLLTPRATGREPPSGEMTGRRLPLLGPEEYARVREAVIRAVVPRDGRSAVVVRMNGDDVMLWFDDAGELRSETGGPPRGVEVVRRLALEDYLAADPGALRRVLAENGISSGEVLFNTGDRGDEPLPFMYANPDARTVAYVGLRAPGGSSASGQGSIVALTRSVTHVLTSHTIGLLTRPVSSLSRLLFMVSDAVRDTLDPTWLLAFEDQTVPPVADRPGMDLAAWEEELDALTGRESGMGRVSYLVGGGEFFPRLEEVVRDARESVLVRTYIFDNDDVATDFADLLRTRADDGVEVRVLMDGMGTIGGGAAPPAGLPDGHATPLSMRRYLANGSEVGVRTSLNPFFTGDHTKTIVVDERIAFIGGMNIGREYRHEWHDLMAEVHGPVVAELVEDFDLAWARAHLMGDLAELVFWLTPAAEPGPPEGHALRVLYTRPTVSEIRKAQLAAIARAQRYVYVQNAYFTDDVFLRELVRARRRGVDVRVIVPLQSDRGILARDNILAANAMFRNGIRVYIYPGMSHIKAAVYDGWACLGSANIDQLSLRVNREANIATSAPEAVEPLLERVFEADFRTAREMREEFPTYWHDRLWELVGDYVF